MTATPRLVGLCLLCACAPACVQDHVYPGFYGEPERAEQASTAVPAGAAGASGVLNAGSSAAVAGAGGAAVPGSGGTQATGVGDAIAATAGAGAPVPAGAGGDACDLSGRWLATLHYVTDALGQQNTVHAFTYYEIERQADGFAITKGLHCGDEVRAEGLFAVTGDFNSARDAVTSRISYAGRSVSSTPAAGGCDVHFGKFYVVRGATYPHYADPSIPLPTLDQPASGTTPGWEDWDGDGNPGITGLLSGTVTGKIFVAPRVWTELSGTVPDTREHLRLSVAWDQEPNMLSYDGSPLLASQAVRAANPSLHFAELVRLPPGQADGADDLSICRAIVELAPMLTPGASAI